MKSRKRRRFLPLLVGACMVLLLAGCGEDESVHTGADAQLGSEAAGGAAETDGSASQEAAEENGDASQGATGTAGEAGAVTEPEEAQQPVGAEGMPAEEAAQQAGPWNQDAEDRIEIDEETRRELTEELLAEENKDTSVMKDGRSTTGCSFDIPEGFAESEEVANLYVRKRYPIDASTIYYAVMEEDIALQLLTKETFAEQMAADLQAAYGEDVEVVVDTFEAVEISGYPAFRILCHYSVGGVEITQLQYAINADRSYMITYSQTSDYDYMELYEASAATIEVK